MKFIKYLSFVSITSVVFVTQLSGQNNKPDSTFNKIGYRITPVGTVRDEVENIALQKDGKVVLIGTCLTGVSTQNLFGVVRYKANGTLDSSFGTNGKITTSPKPGVNRPFGVGIQDDQKIVVAGWWSTDTSENWLVVRYKANGQLDSTFGTNGINVHNFISGESETAVSVALQPDGKILVGGEFRGTDNRYNMVVIRYLSNGILDNSFGTKGVALFDPALESYNAAAMILQKDGRIVIGGTASKDGIIYCGLGRLNSNGTIDNTFGKNGLALLKTVASGNVQYSDIAVQEDGKYLASGECYNPGLDFIVTRITTNGIVDSTFGKNGSAITDIATKGDHAWKVIAQADGKILAVGHAFTSGFNLALVRYKSDGKLDSAFGTSGKMLLMAGGYATQGKTAILQPDGKILAAGHSTISGSNTDFTLYRIMNEIKVGIIDLAINNGTVLIYPNPVKEHFNIQYTLTKEENLSISLVDLQGKFIVDFLQNTAQSPGEYNQQFAIPQGLKSGNYLVLIASPKGKMSIQIQL